MVPELNLLPKTEKHRSVMSAFVVAGVVLWFLLFSFLLFQYFTAKSEIKRMEQRMELLVLHNKALESELEIQQGSAAYIDTVSIMEDIALSASPIIKELVDLLPENANLLSYDYRNGEVSILTEMRSLPMSAEYSVKLLSSPLFTDVKIGQITHNTQSGEETGRKYDVSFSLTVDRSVLRNGEVTEHE